MNPCPFCRLDPERQILAENALAFATYDRFPVSEGHALIIPRRHEADYFSLLPDEQRACWALVNEVRELLQARHRPDGFNVGINCGEAAGQTVFHVHIHLIPRYTGDVARPRGGVRGVKPEERDYGG